MAASKAILIIGVSRQTSALPPPPSASSKSARRKAMSDQRWVNLIRHGLPFPHLAKKQVGFAQFLING
jgi:hypothetical protein